VSPKQGLALGTYSATAIIRAQGGSVLLEPKTLTLSFSMESAHIYGISLNRTGTQTFAEQEEGYTERETLTAVITNTGNKPTGPLSVSVSNSSLFALSATDIDSVAAGRTARFEVSPQAGLAVASAYTATVTVSGAEAGSAIVPRSFDVSFAVRARPVLRFDTMGGSPQPPEQKVAAGTHGSAPSVTVSKDGLNFAGWFASNGSAAFDFAGTPINADTTLYARWTATMTFDTAGGSPATLTREVTEGAKAAAPDAASFSPPSAGLAIEAWYPPDAAGTIDGFPINSASGSAVPFDFANTPITGPVTLQAGWGFVVSFTLNGGSGSFPNQTVRHNGVAFKPAANPTRAGHNFLYWSTSPTGSNGAYDFRTLVTVPFTLHAIWTPIQ
jgi:hypothetical protein